MPFRIIICQKTNYVESFNLKNIYFFFNASQFLAPASYHEAAAPGTGCSWQHDNSTSAKPPGTRLGLPVLLQLVLS